MPAPRRLIAEQTRATQPEAITRWLVYHFAWKQLSR